ncbi:MAG: cell division protein ZapE, partial [Thiohalophilus sp.]
MITPLDRYRAELQRDDFLHDPHQEVAVEQFQRLFQQLLQTSKKHQGRLARLLGRKCEPIRGLYLWGGTGRGKTHLMDSFYDCLPFRDRHRVHYHRFMIDIHARLRDLPRSPDPLVVIADEIADQLKVLCLDEFHVQDIADAMLLGGLLKALFDKGVTLVATSNTPIDLLYKNGLQ